MATEIRRRSLAKGAAWGIPAVVVASAAPAFAASCTPKTVTTSSAVKWSSTQIGCTSPNGGDPELHTVQYTLTNEGPDAVPAGVELDVKVTISVLQGEDAQVSIQQTSGSISGTVTNQTTDNGDGTVTLVATVKIVTTAALAVNESASVTVLATYGVVSTDGATEAQETVTADSPQTITDAATCLTTIATVTVSGSSDGTSYTSPASCSS